MGPVDVPPDSAVNIASSVSDVLLLFFSCQLDTSLKRRATLSLVPQQGSPYRNVDKEKRVAVWVQALYEAGNTAQ